MSRQERKRFRVRISALEADVAYFDARLALLNGQSSSSCYQEAQVRAYRELEGVLSEMLNRLQRLQSREGKGGGSAMEVEELSEVSAPEG